MPSLEKSSLEFGAWDVQDLNSSRALGLNGLGLGCSENNTNSIGGPKSNQDAGNPHAVRHHGSTLNPNPDLNTRNPKPVRLGLGLWVWRVLTSVFFSY